jgi:hypothetical protein
MKFFFLQRPCAMCSVQSISRPLNTKCISKNDCLVIVWWMPDDFLMTLGWLSDDSWMSPGWLSDDSQMTLGWLADDLRMTLWWLSYDSWMTLGWLLDDSWMTLGWLSDYRTHSTTFLTIHCFQNLHYYMVPKYSCILEIGLLFKMLNSKMQESSCQLL